MNAVLNFVYSAVAALNSFLSAYGVSTLIGLIALFVVYVVIQSAVDSSKSKSRLAVAEAYDENRHMMIVVEGSNQGKWAQMEEARNNERYQYLVEDAQKRAVRH